MEPFFSPFDPRYAAIAFSVVLLDAFVLRAVLPLRAWCLLRLPSTFLHELAHLVTAVLLGGRARMTVFPRVEQDGSLTLGRVDYEDVGMGFIGTTLVSLAPLAWLLAGLVMSRIVLAQPHAFWEGLGWLAACMSMVGAGLRLSGTDLAGMDWFTRACTILFLITFALGGVLLQLPMALCGWFEPSCQFLLPEAR